MSEAGRNPDDYCYRHPDRLSFVLCERCGRTICLECQNHVGGRVLCPDDAKVIPITQSKARVRTRRTRTTRELPRWLEGQPVVSYAIIAIVFLIFLVDAIVGHLLMPHLWVIPGLTLSQPWSLVTSMFTSTDILSVLLGGLSIWSIGRILEPHLGRQRFIVLYLVSGFGASVFAFLLDGAVTSWFGAISGLAGAAVVLARRMGVMPILLYVSVGITVVLSIFLGGWQAAIGGLLAGAGVGFIYFFDDDHSRQRRTRTLLIAVGAGLLVLAVLRALVFAA
jgi:membrane associated rhomboid family serine protease